jgi:methyltransferase family protein
MLTMVRADMTSASRFKEAQEYVGNPGEDYFIVGLLQLELLRMNGCSPDSHVLEIGCGALVAGRPIMHFLKPDHYVGIEPNSWLIEAAKDGLPDTRRHIAEKRPIFLNNADFDASQTGRKFDYVISHSILSHAAVSQYPQLLKAVRKTLAPHGVVLASIRLADENNPESNFDEWQYPGVSYFGWQTVNRVAVECGYEIEGRPDYRDFFMRYAPLNYHDWIRLTPAGRSPFRKARRGEIRGAARAIRRRLLADHRRPGST